LASARNKEENKLNEKKNKIKRIEKNSESSWFDWGFGDPQSNFEPKP